MENKKMLIIQIPDELIRNTYFKMDSNTFAAYTYLKFLHFRNFNNNDLEINHNHFKHKLYISDNRTLKKVFTNLHKHQFILEFINRFPTKGLLKFTFDPMPYDTNTFTQLPATILNKIDNIGLIGLRLLFYYESFINRSEDTSKQFAFPAIETISKSLGMNKETIINYNNILVKHKLLKIVKHKLEFTNDYTELDKPLFTKYNNHYYVKLEQF